MTAKARRELTHHKTLDARDTVQHPDPMHVDTETMQYCIDLSILRKEYYDPEYNKIYPDGQPELYDHPDYDDPVDGTTTKKHRIKPKMTDATRRTDP